MSSRGWPLLRVNVCQLLASVVCTHVSKVHAEVAIAFQHLAMVTFSFFFFVVDWWSVFEVITNSSGYIAHTLKSNVRSLGGQSTEIISKMAKSRHVSSTAKTAARLCLHTILFRKS